MVGINHLLQFLIDVFDALLATYCWY